jgi:hypothetical protein
MLFAARPVVGDHTYVYGLTVPLAVGLPPICIPVGLQLGWVTSGPAFTVGLDLTFTTDDAVAVHVCESVTVTVYVAVETGVTVGFAIDAAPLLHAYVYGDVPPDAVVLPPILTLSPRQMK